MKLIEIAKHLNGILKGPQDVDILRPAKIEEAAPGEITFISNPRYKHFLETTKASAVIVDQSAGDVRIPHILVENAYMGFLLLLRLFEPKRGFDFSGISKNAEIHKTAKIAENSNIGPFVYIGSNSTIGRNCIIYPGVVILNDVSVGENCIIYPNVSIREQCIIGNNVILQNNVVIGGDGFGFAPHAGKYEKIPQIGNVVIEDDVEIGANTTVDRATVGSTVIKKGAKLDNLVQVAHNCVVGEHTVIAAQAGISGSTTIGNSVTIGGQAGLVGHIKIGDGSAIAAQSGITKDVKPKEILFGTPAYPISERKKIEVSIKHLPNAIKRIKQLEGEVVELKNLLNIDQKGNDQ